MLLRMCYTAESVKATIEAGRTRLFAGWSVNRPINWACDSRTQDMVCLGVWLDEEMRRLGLDDLGRTTQGSQFNRRSRSEEDLWTLAAQIMNDTVAGKIDRDRVPLRRWG